MGLMDKAKGLVEQHRDQVEHHMQKVTDLVNKHAGGSPPPSSQASEAAKDDGTTDPDVAVPGDGQAEYEASQTSPDHLG